MILPLLQLLCGGALLWALRSVAGPTPHWALRLVGSLLLLAGAILLLRAVRDLGPSLRVQVQPAPGARLVREGVYARLRHPIYSGLMLILLALVLLVPSPLTALAAAANGVLYYAKSRLEERYLARLHPEYEPYRRATRGMFLL